MRGQVTVPEGVQVKVYSGGGTSSGGVNDLKVDGKTVHEAGDDRSKNSWLDVDVVPGDSIDAGLLPIAKRVVSGEGEGNLLLWLCSGVRECSKQARWILEKVMESWHARKGRTGCPSYDQWPVLKQA